METYIALLRGINVANQKKVSMEKLRALFGTLGFTDARTYIQSGNVVFRSKKTSEALLRSSIEEKIRTVLGFEVVVLIRTPAQLRETVSKNPFPKKDAARLYVSFLSETPARVPLGVIGKYKAASEEFRLVGRDLYLLFPDGYGRTKLSNAFFERHLGVKATTRNWNTLNALVDMAAEATGA